MKKYFKVNFEFNHSKFEKLIIESIKENKKGYCCFVDLFSLVNSHQNPEILKVLNNSMLNSCDGSYISFFASKIHNENLKEYIGPDFFKKFIYSSKRHLIIGNTKNVFDKICEKVEVKNKNSDNLHYMNIPFVSVTEFNYSEIAAGINKIAPDYIWVSLGAPKQEIFMYNILPLINKGVLLGVGAATNYFSNEIPDIPNWTKKMHVIWIYRIFTEPKKQISRMSKVILKFPKILINEIFRKDE